MNILMLNVSSDLYGSSKILKQTAIALKKKGHQPIVLLSETGPLEDEFNKIGIPTKIIRLGVLRRKYLSVGGLINRIKVLFKAYQSIKEICREQKIELIYTNTTPVIIGGIVAKLLGIKNLWHIHEILPINSKEQRFFGWLINWSSDKVIVVSSAVYENWSNKIDKRKLVLLHNGIDELEIIDRSIDLRNSLKLPINKILVGMIGRVNLFKGQSYFIEIAAAINAKPHDCHFVMVGDAYPGYEYLYDQLAEQKKILGVDAIITDLGYRTDIPMIMNSLDIFVLPSTKPDPFPTVILEAMSVQKPVVATKQGGACESVVHGLTGYLVPLENPVSVADHILTLAENDSLQKEMGKAGKERFKLLYSISQFETSIVDEVESMMA
jgi:glycosyltransferase involved in cell wall biosynthesis